MRYRHLGDSGLMVSVVGIGCNNFGGRIDAARAAEVVHAALDHGVTLFDTADVYGAGHSERLLAPVLAANPHVLVATKFGNTFDEDTRQLTGVDTNPGHVRQALQGSLRRLGRDHVDLYQLHFSDVDDNRASWSTKLAAGIGSKTP